MVSNVRDRMRRQLGPAEHRPATRRLVDLDNTELSLLFSHRAAILEKALNGHSFWDSRFIVYWGEFQKIQESLYEVMMEIQSRYPDHEYFDALPVKESKEL